MSTTAIVVLIAAVLFLLVAVGIIAQGTGGTFSRRPDQTAPRPPTRRQSINLHPSQRKDQPR